MSFTVNLLNQVASKCESFAITLLDKCTTKHEIQTLLQTKCVQPQLYFLYCFMNISPVPRSYRGHHDANFNVAILDGHKEIVAHEKFQQLLHKKWGQRDKIHYGDDIRCLVTLSPWTFPKQASSTSPRPVMLTLNTLRYNIFWSEMSKVQKLGHVIKQVSN